MIAGATVLSAIRKALLGDVAGWFRDVLAETASVSLPLLLLGLALQTCQTLLNALAWRNILRAAYPQAGVRFGQTLAIYAGGAGLNSVMPAQAGTVAMLALFRAQIAGSTVPGVLAASVAQSVFFLLVGVSAYTAVVLSRPETFHVKLAWLPDHPVLAVAALLVAALVVGVAWRRGRRGWEKARQGVTIMTMPGRYAREVLTLQIGAYVARLAVTACFMSAYGVPLSFLSVLVILAANSLSTTFSVTPGGVGTQQALASVALRHYASSTVITAYSLGQQLVLAGFDVMLGAVLLWATIGLRATRDAARRRQRRPDVPTAR